jgi:hypothetical protein
MLLTIKPAFAERNPKRGVVMTRLGPEAKRRYRSLAASGAVSPAYN